jgi:hypothetical protein
MVFELDALHHALAAACRGSVRAGRKIIPGKARGKLVLGLHCRSLSFRFARRSRTGAFRDPGRTNIPAVPAGAAERQICFSYPRLDLEQGRPRVPSFYALEALRASEGRLPDFSEFGKARKVL